MAPVLNTSIAMSQVSLGRRSGMRNLGLYAAKAMQNQKRSMGLQEGPLASHEQVAAIGIAVTLQNALVDLVMRGCAVKHHETTGLIGSPPSGTPDFGSAAALPRAGPLSWQQPGAAG